MTDGKATGWRRIVRAFGFSRQGLKACYEHEAAFRQEVWGLTLLAPLGLWLGENPVERAMLVGSLLLVPIVELLNSAIEANVDRVGPEPHELALRARQGHRLRRRPAQPPLRRGNLGPAADSQMAVRRCPRRDALRFPALLHHFTRFGLFVGNALRGVPNGPHNGTARRNGTEAVPYAV